MKANNKWITAAAVLGLSASLAIAGTQAGEGRHGDCKGKGREEHGGRMAEKLNLTDAQREQWKAIRKSSHEQNAAFFAQSRQNMDQLHAAREAGDTAKADSLKPVLESQRAQMKQIRDAEEQKLISILNTEQQAKFQTMKAEREAHRAEWKNHQK